MHSKSKICFFQRHVLTTPFLSKQSQCFSSMSFSKKLLSRMYPIIYTNMRLAEHFNDKISLQLNCKSLLGQFLVMHHPVVLPNGKLLPRATSFFHVYKEKKSSSRTMTSAASGYGESTCAHVLIVKPKKKRKQLQMK